MLRFRRKLPLGALHHFAKLFSQNLIGMPQAKTFAFWSFAPL
jgi:hypothetical protein